MSSTEKMISRVVVESSWWMRFTIAYATRSGGNDSTADCDIRTAPVVFATFSYFLTMLRTQGISPVMSR